MKHLYAVPKSATIHQTAIINRLPEHRDWLRAPDRPYLPVVLGEDVIIQPYVTIDGGIAVPTRVGDRCLLLAKCHVGHDAIIGNDCELATGCIIGGHARIGDRVRIGLNAVILPGVTVVSDVRIGAGAIVVKDVHDRDTVWGGSPARDLHPESTDYNRKLVANAVGRVKKWTCRYEDI